MDITISPLDNRYFSKVKEITDSFSYYNWVKYRLKVEIDYLVELVKVINSDENNNDNIHYKYTTDEINYFSNEFKIKYQNFNLDELNVILDYEKNTRHDIKAIEYYICNFLDTLEPKYHKLKNLVHFGLTSQDVNSVAFSLQLKDCIINTIIPYINQIINKIDDYSNQWKDITIMAYTHGQPAIPTKLGKELLVYRTRLTYWFNYLKSFSYYTKMGGAVGNLNAHKLAYPFIDWETFFSTFVRKYNLIRWYKTTQITNYDDIINLSSYIMNINNVLVDLSQDMWLYISKSYFGLKKTSIDQVGSSTMPQKVNPIDFENAEGNLKISNSGLNMLINKLPVSRLQRDLTDSTVLRNVGVPISHTIIGIKSTIKGLNKLVVNKQKITEDLEKNWIVISEAIQTILRREGVDKPYELLKDLTRNNAKIDQKVFIDFISQLDISENVKKELLSITPFNYTGY